MLTTSKILIKTATALSTLVLNVNFSVTATCIFYLRSPINCTSPWT